MTVDYVLILATEQYALVSVSGDEFTQHIFREGGLTLDRVLDYFESKGNEIQLFSPDKIDDLKALCIRWSGINSRAYQSLSNYSIESSLSKPLRTGQ